MARAEASMAARGTLTAMDQGTIAGRGMAVLPKAWARSTDRKSVV